MSGREALFPFQSAFRGGHLIEKDLWVQFEIIENPNYPRNLETWQCYKKGHWIRSAHWLEFPGS